MRDEYIQAEIKAAGGNISRAARTLDLDYADTKARFGTELNIQPIVRPEGPIPELIESLAKVGWEHWVIAVKKNNDPWPARFTAAIHDGRRKFDAGTHIMCQQKRTDGWIVLYLRPRRFPLRRPQPYFSRILVL